MDSISAISSFMDDNEDTDNEIKNQKERINQIKVEKEIIIKK